jgi:hypothetical protein
MNKGKEMPGPYFLLDIAPNTCYVVSLPLNDTNPALKGADR